VTSTFFFDHTRSPASEVSGLASALGAMFSSRGGSMRVRSLRSNDFLLAVRTMVFSEGEESHGKEPCADFTTQNKLPKKRSRFQSCFPFTKHVRNSSQLDDHNLVK
jgi:hypothetical protein